MILPFWPCFADSFNSARSSAYYNQFKINVGKIEQMKVNTMDLHVSWHQFVCTQIEFGIVRHRRQCHVPSAYQIVSSHPSESVESSKTWWWRHLKFTPGMTEFRTQDQLINNWKILYSVTNPEWSRFNLIRKHFKWVEIDSWTSERRERRLKLEIADFLISCSILFGAFEQVEFLKLQV